MSGSLNKVMLIGNLGDDVKVHHFDEKNCVARFPIATNESYTLRDTGEKVTQTEWHRIIVRNKLAELCEKYLSKGDSVYVEGKIKTRKWNDNGQDRYQVEIQAETVQFLNTKNSAAHNDDVHDGKTDATDKNENENPEDFPF